MNSDFWAGFRLIVRGLIDAAQKATYSAALGGIFFAAAWVSATHVQMLAGTAGVVLSISAFLLGARLGRAFDDRAGRKKAEKRPQPSESEHPRVLRELERLHEFQRELLDLVVNKATLCDGPVALYAIREVDPDIRYFRNKNAAPRALVEQRHVGSEGQLAYIINVLSSDGSGKYLNHPPLKTLKKKRCHNIFLIDDLCGSGQRAKK